MIMLKNFTSPDMLYALAALALAFLVAYYGTPLAKLWAIRCRCFDHPDGERKLHAAPIPYFGGLAILAGFSVAFLLFTYMLILFLALFFIKKWPRGFVMSLASLLGLQVSLLF